MNWYDDLTKEDAKELISSPDNCDPDHECYRDRPKVCPKTRRPLVYDKHTGQALDAETLMPIENYVDFTNQKIL